MDLYFAGREVTLEVGHIVHCVPQTEFHIGKYLKFLWGIRVICQGKLVDLTGVTHRDEISQLRGQTILAASKLGVSHTVTALVGIKLCLGWHPARIPDGVSFFNIVVMTVAIVRYIVVTITGQAEKLRILLEAVSTTGV